MAAKRILNDDSSERSYSRVAQKRIDFENVVVPDNWTNDRKIKRLKRDESIQPDHNYAGAFNLYSNHHRRVLGQEFLRDRRSLLLFSCASNGGWPWRPDGTYDRRLDAKNAVTAIELSNKAWLNFGVYLFGVRYTTDDRLAKSVFAHIINVGSP